MATLWKFGKLKLIAVGKFLARLQNKSWQNLPVWQRFTASLKTKNGPYRLKTVA